MVLQYQLAYVKHTLEAAQQRKVRLEDVMSRKGAKKWDAAKKAVMVRRLVNATQTIEQCVGAVDEITKKLEVVMAQLDARVGNAAPFIKGPAESVVPDQLFDPEAQQQIAPPEIESPFGG